MTTQADSGFATERPVPKINLPSDGEDLAGSASVLEPTIRVRDLRVASVAYKEFREQQPDGSGPSVESWCESRACPPEQAKLYHDLHRSNPAAASRLADAVLKMPDVGADFLGFELIGELGRGAFARAYLARQRELADRLVVLKVSAELSDEPQTLAQLQHTNIVPIYSIHYVQPFLAVCMPYFGATTLQDVYADLKSLPRLPDSGKGLVSTLNAHKSTVRKSSLRGSDKGPSTARKPHSAPAVDVAPAAAVPAQTESGHTLKLLEGMTYIEAVLWIGARLADGLAHAHERGIYHRDLKPANVLLTDEGQPMLLDFNLSEDIKAAGASAALIGGTLPYMPPEQLDAFRGGEQPVDGRGDVFALGIILYELLTRRHPYEMPKGKMHTAIPQMIEDRLKPPPGLRRWNAAVPPAVESIVRHCLEGDPAQRYQSARELQEDLERLLDHRPLKYAPEPSLLNRGRRWLRRHPILVRSALVGAAVFLLALAAGLTAQAYTERQRSKAVDQLRLFSGDKRTAEYLLIYRRNNPRIRATGLRECARVLQRYQVLENPGWQELPAIQRLRPGEADALRADVGKLLLLYVRNLLPDALALRDEAERAKDLRSALELNERAEACYPPGEAPPFLWGQRAEIHRALKDDAAAKKCDALAKQPPRTSLDRYFKALEHFAKYEWAEAAALFHEITQEDPGHYWAWFMQGICLSNQSEHADAFACFTVCVTLRPDEWWGYFDRARTSQFTRAFRRAIEDIDVALTLVDDRDVQADLYFNRGSAHYGLNQDREAVDDYTKALQLGAPYTRIYFHRAEAYRRLGRLTEAQRDWNEGMRRPPTDTRSWSQRGLAKLAAQPPDLAGALEDFRHAVGQDRTNQRAWQDAAHTLMRLGRGEETIRCLTQAIKFFPHFKEFRSGRGVQYARLGQRQLAYQDAAACLPSNSAMITYQVAGIYALLVQQDRAERRKALLLLSTTLASRSCMDGLGSLAAVYDGEARAERLQTLQLVPVALQGSSVLAQAAGLHAVSSQRGGADRRKALALLQDALEHGFGMSVLDHDPELNPIRDRPEFLRLSRGVAVLRSALDPVGP